MLDKLKDLFLLIVIDVVVKVTLLLIKFYEYAQNPTTLDLFRLFELSADGILTLIIFRQILRIYYEEE